MTLVAQNLGLVMSIVRKYEDKGVQASDLVQVPPRLYSGLAAPSMHHLMVIG